MSTNNIIIVIPNDYDKMICKTFCCKIGKWCNEIWCDKTSIRYCKEMDIKKEIEFYIKHPHNSKPSIFHISMIHTALNLIDKCSIAMAYFYLECCSLFLENEKDLIEKTGVFPETFYYQECIDFEYTPIRDYLTKQVFVDMEKPLHKEIPTVEMFSIVNDYEWDMDEFADDGFVDYDGFDIDIEKAGWRMTLVCCINNRFCSILRCCQELDSAGLLNDIVYDSKYYMKMMINDIEKIIIPEFKMWWPKSEFRNKLNFYWKSKFDCDGDEFGDKFHFI